MAVSGSHEAGDFEESARVPKLGPPRAVKNLARFLAGADLPAEALDGGREIRLVGLIVLVGTVTATLFCAIVHLTTGLGYPYDTFLFRPSVRFSDFTQVYGLARSYGPPHDTTTVYSTELHLLMTLATALPASLVWLAFNALFLATLVCVVWFGVCRRIGGRPVRVAYTLIFVTLSYPVLFVLDRGNLEMLLFVALAAFAYLHYVRKSAWSWLPLALAVAGKYYLATLLVLYVKERRWRELGLALAAIVGVTLGSAVALSLHSGFSVLQVLENTRTTLGGFADRFTYLAVVQHGHTLWGLVCMLIVWLNPPVVASHLEPYYFVVCLALFAWVSVRVVNLELAPWQSFTALLVAGLVLPFQSNDYTLVHMVLPLALIGAYGVQTRHGRRSAVLIALLLIPTAYVVLIVDVTSSVIVYPLVCVTLLATCLRAQPSPVVVEDRVDSALSTGSETERGRGRPAPAITA
jgi:hypothetical protein